MTSMPSSARSTGGSPRTAFSVTTSWRECYARSGLITDVQLYEDYPSRYSGDVSRRHRWIRGDWQIAGWLWRRVPGAEGARPRNPLPVLSQWKLLDNLRRSLVPPALLLLLLLGWTVLAPAWGWTLAALGILAVPSLLASLLDLLRKPDDVPLAQHVGFASRTAARRAVQIAFSLACLPYEAWFSADAILRTHWRMLVTRKRLLEWTPSSEQYRRDRTTLVASFRAMATGPAVAVAAASHLLSTNPAVLLVAGPILLLWLFSPALAWWISRPLKPHVASADARADCLPAQAGSPHLGVLRDVRRPRRQLAATRQLPGGPRRDARASHVADQHGRRAARRPGCL